jgi:hypothetical protein
LIHGIGPTYRRVEIGAAGRERTLLRVAGPSTDFKDYSDDAERPAWHNRQGPPAVIAAAFGGFGLVVGLVLGWLTDLRTAPPAVVGGLVGILGFDFYWRFVRESLPRKGSRASSPK